MRSEFLRICETDPLPFPDADNFQRSFTALHAEPSDIQTRSAHGTFLLAFRNRATLTVQVGYTAVVSKKGACEM
jgi:hypothetical protein